MRKVAFMLVLASVVVLAGCSRGEIHESYKIPTVRSTVVGPTRNVTEMYVSEAPAPFVVAKPAAPQWELRRIKDGETWILVGTPDGGKSWYLLNTATPVDQAPEGDNR